MLSEIIDIEFQYAVRPGHIIYYFSADALKVIKHFFLFGEMLMIRLT